MSTEENKALVQRYLASLNEFKATKNYDLFDEFFTPDVALHFNGFPPEMQGREALKQVMSMFITAFPDLHITKVYPIVAEEELVAVRVSWSGTHLGELMGIPATGKQVSVADIHIERVVNGKIVERFGATDAMGLMQQLGVVPSPQ